MKPSSAIAAFALCLVSAGLLNASQAQEALGPARHWPQSGEPGSPFPATIAATPMAEGYLAPGALDSAALLGPPPSIGSPRERADRATFRATRRLAGTARWRLATEDNDLGGGAFRRFSCAAGVTVLPTTTPATARIMLRIDADTRNLGLPVKLRYSRLRPLIGNRLPICVPRAAWMWQNPSYPSAHATEGWAWALVLAELRPDQADALLQNGREFGESRIICGVHFESDVEAGRLLGAAMVARLHTNPAFLADMAQAREELATAARTGPAPYDCAR